MMRWLQITAATSLIALILLCLAWEGWLTPLRPGGSFLVLKAMPLLLPLLGILRGKRFTFQWASMVILLYFMEGTVRAYADVGVSAWLGMLEIVLSLTFFIAAILFARWAVQNKPGT
jgi:uncharacterized membrane protein